MDFPDLASAGAFLAGLSRHGIHPEMDSIGRVLSGFGNPQYSFPAVQVAGTNGKGTTAVILASLFQAAGFRTGLFTSPHLLDVRERIQIDGQPLDPTSFLTCLRDAHRVQERLGLSLTFFEILTVIGFLAFERASVDIAILEVGLGGRWDATSTSRPDVSVLTSISKDHTEILGETLEKILQEKAAIGRFQKPFVATFPEHLLNEWSGIEEKKGFLSVLRGRDFNGDWTSPDHLGKRFFEYQGRAEKKTLQTALVARYQLNNLLSAMAVLEFGPWEISDEVISAALPAVRNPGRWERLSQLPVILDGAHNPESMSELVAQICEVFPDPERVGFLTGFIRGKDWEEMLRILPGAGRTFFLTTPPETDAVDPELLASCLGTGQGCFHKKGPFDLMSSDALEWASQGHDRILVVTGSLYLVGGFKRWQAGSRSPLSVGERNVFPSFHP
ncbi:MAG: bifunctional folylpolyglutamate synthase/dihydrofolate synthase [Leptospirales bacterium]